MLQTLLDSCAALGVPLTAAQAEKLCEFGARLLEQNRVMNLTAITEPQAVAKLHFADCLALLRIVPFSGRRVIDVGCGSGILSIVALKLGASAVVGTDLDPDCMTSTHENMEVNHLDPSLGTFYVGNLIDDAALQEKVGTEEYDIVVANILADVIIPMAPVIPARLKRGGYFITSGIIDFKENAVKEAIEAAGLTVVEINHQGEWVNITARKPE